MALITSDLFSRTPSVVVLLELGAFCASLRSCGLLPAQLENSLKMVREFTVNFKTEVSAVQDGVERVTNELQKRAVEISTNVTEVKKDISDHEKRFVDFGKVENELQDIKHRIESERDASKSTSTAMEKRLENER